MLARILKIGALIGFLAHQALASPDSASVKESADLGVTVKTEHSIAFVGMLLPHRALRNSESLHNWPFFGFVAPMGWTSKVALEKPILAGLVFKGNAVGSVSLGGIAVRSDVSLDLWHLLEVGVDGGLNSGINYGSMMTSMGVYSPEKQEYSADLIGTEFAYEVRYHAAFSIPLMAFLPRSNWTKIILKPSASLIYSAYTGADDGEVWKAGGENLVNGYRYRVGGTLLYMLPFQSFPMAMISANVSGFKHEYDFDPVYKPYNPGFKTVAVTPMLMMKVSEKWSGMVMVNFGRERLYREYPYEPNTELSQEYVGSEWGLKAILVTLSRKF